MTALQKRFRMTGVSLLWLTYLSYLLVIPSVLGLIVNVYESKALRQLADQEGTEKAEVAKMLWSHHEWLRRTFVMFFVFGMMAVGTAYYGFGLVLGAGVVAWWIYRVVRGMVALSATHTLPVTP